ncbi:MAG: hypothetical protein WD771_11330 [Gemmatimonadaceae bacterium]
MNRSAPIALVVGSLAGLVTMVLHPTGGDVVDVATAGGANALVTAVHALALLGQPLLLTGMLALTVQLRARRDLAIGAFVFFAFASVAVLIAGAASGFVSPAAVRGLGDADDLTRAGMMNAMHYTGLLNQAFAKIYVLFTGIALVLWAAAMLLGRELSRALAVYGAILGVVLLAGVLTGQLRLDIHGFGAVVLGQGIWMVWTARRLWVR